MSNLEKFKDAIVARIRDKGDVVAVAGDKRDRRFFPHLFFH